MISLHGTLTDARWKGELGDAAATAASTSATVAATMGARVICPFYTFGRARVPGAAGIIHW
jgi:hypothetical protein